MSLFIWFISIYIFLYVYMITLKQLHINTFLNLLKRFKNIERKNIALLSLKKYHFSNSKKQILFIPAISISLITIFLSINNYTVKNINVYIVSFIFFIIFCYVIKYICLLISQQLYQHIQSNNFQIDKLVNGTNLLYYLPSLLSTIIISYSLFFI